MRMHIAASAAVPLSNPPSIRHCHRDLIASAEVWKQVLAWLQAEQDAHDGGWVLVPKEACCG